MHYRIHKMVRANGDKDSKQNTHFHRILFDLFDRAKYITHKGISQKKERTKLKLIKFGHLIKQF